MRVQASQVLTRGDSLESEDRFGVCKNKLGLLLYLVCPERDIVLDGGHLLRDSEIQIQCNSTASEVAEESHTAFDELSALDAKSTRSSSLLEQLNFLQTSFTTF